MEIESQNRLRRALAGKDEHTLLNGAMIRRLTLRDINVWRTLALEAIEKHPECFVTTVDEERAISHSWFKAQIDKRHVFVAGNDEGLAVLRLDNKVGYITSVYVQRLARGNGLADQLLSVIWATAENEKCRRIVVQVFEDNIPANSLYQKHGYKLAFSEPFGNRIDCRLERAVSGS